MPLTKSGAKVKASMSKQYGAGKGERVFYASINAKKAGSKKWHRKTGKAAPVQRSMMRSR
jgi:hypothetical protein